MNLLNKFVLGIVTVFAILALSIAGASFLWVDQNTVRDAQQRVQLYIQSSWEIYNNKLDKMQAVLEILSHDQQLRLLLLLDPNNETQARAVRDYLESVRQAQSMDVLNVIDAQGVVVLRTRAPYNRGDSVATDPLVKRALSTQAVAGGTILVSQERLKIGGDGLLERCLQFGGEPQGMFLSAVQPIIVNGQVIGALQMGNLLNGASDKVDRIRDTVFRNEQYNGKPLGTATIFMGDLRISTNVLDRRGERAIGTRASLEVANQVLTQGLPWTGRAWVVDTWYLAQYDPIRDPDGKIIGMLYVGELEQKYLDLRTQALALFLSVILAGMLLAFLVFFLIARGIVAPIHRLAYATKRIAGGDLAYRLHSTIPPASRDEVKRLAAAFDEMAEQLQTQHDEIDQDRRALAKLNDELQTTNRNYMEMLGFVSHELKNPLSSAMLNVGTVKDGYVGELNETQKGALESVLKSLRYFREMIADYLDLSRLEKGELRVNPSRFALVPDAMAPAIESMARVLQEKQMTLENHVPPALELTADRDLIRIVYDNLLSNAVKYGKDGGKVVLDARVAHNEIELSVLNEGSGIEPDKLPLLFQKFSRVANVEHGRKKGTGLGLYICKEIVEKHGGKMRAESQLGAWTKFIFTLPMSNDP